MENAVKNRKCIFGEWMASAYDVEPNCPISFSMIKLIIWTRCRHQNIHYHSCSRVGNLRTASRVSYVNVDIGKLADNHPFHRGRVVHWLEFYVSHSSCSQTLIGDL